MRLDKFLKVSRLIKRRTLAKEVADQGRIEINGTAAKASSTVKEGDEMVIRFGHPLWPKTCHGESGPLEGNHKKRSSR